MKKKPFNPFYVLLLLVGVAFTVTASAYGVMTYRATQPISDATAGDGEHPMLAAVATYGTAAMGVEVLLLAVFTVGAIATDDYWIKKHARVSKREKQPSL